MKADNCPYWERCFILGSLQALNLPHIMEYCSQNYDSCRYYQRQVQTAKKEPKEILV